MFYLLPVWLQIILDINNMSICCEENNLYTWASCITLTCYYIIEYNAIISQNVFNENSKKVN